MKAMAAEYEAVIAPLKKKNKGGNKGGKGNASHQQFDSYIPHLLQKHKQKEIIH